MSDTIRLKPFKYRKNTFSLKIKKEGINKKKEKDGLMPNLIHSIDAASLALIVDNLFIIKDSKNDYINFNFFSIHDCFAVTCNNVNKLIKIIKIVYIKIYSEDNYLNKFNNGIINNIKLTFGENSFNHKTNEIKINGNKINYPDINKVVKGKIAATSISNSVYIIN